MEFESQRDIEEKLLEETLKLPFTPSPLLKQESRQRRQLKQLQQEYRATLQEVRGNIVSVSFCWNPSPIIQMSIVLCMKMTTRDSCVNLCSFSVLWTGARTKWRNTKDWKQTVQFPCCNVDNIIIANQQQFLQKKQAKCWSVLIALCRVLIMMVTINSGIYSINVGQY